MSRSPERLRAKALLLLLLLLAGGFGLPIVDALVFHSATRAPVPTQAGIAGAPESGSAHLLGCAVWSSLATSTGLPCVPLTGSIALARSPEASPLAPADLSTQTDRTLALSRAPPSA